MAKVILFASRQIADDVMYHIARTPDLEGGVGKTWLWFDPSRPENSVQVNEGADGRCLVSHPWSETDIDWLATKMQTWMDRGEASVMDGMPADWVSKAEGV